jgi:SSS family solute:Na+ symporter
VYRTYLRKQATGEELIRFGRIVTLLVLVAATGVGFFLQDLKAIFIYIQKFWSIAYPSVCALFLAGFFYKRATARGALVAVIVGPAWALGITALEELKLLPAIPYLTVLQDHHYIIPFLTRGAIDFVFAVLIIWIFRNRGAIPDHAIIDRTLPPEISAELKAIPWYKSFGFWATLLILCVVALYIRFF